MNAIKTDISAPPNQVVRLSQCLDKYSIWHRISPNFKEQEAFSCRDAASKRMRLGHIGIGLWEELKTIMCEFHDDNGKAQYVLAHCRADHNISIQKLQKIVKGKCEPNWVTPAKLNNFGLEYGLVNPFYPILDNSRKSSSIQQIFDKGLMDYLRPPGTIMTNACHRRWAVELHIDELINNLNNSVVESIATPTSTSNWHHPNRSSPKLGILTGNAPESGIVLWQHINRTVRSLMGRECLGDISMPPVVVNSIPEMGLTMELPIREVAIWKWLEKAIHDLCKQDICYLSIPCHTTHFFTEKIRSICSQYGVTFVSMAETLRQRLDRDAVNSLALIGIDCVAELGKWSAYRGSLEGLNIEILSPQAKRRVNRIAYRVKKEGANERGLNLLRDILNQEVKSRHVVLALTELSMLLSVQRRKNHRGKELIDPLDLYAKALAKHFLHSIPLSE